MFMFILIMGTFRVCVRVPNLPKQIHAAEQFTTSIFMNFDNGPRKRNSDSSRQFIFFLIFVQQDYHEMF